MVSSRFCRRSAMFFTVLIRLVSGSSPAETQWKFDSLRCLDLHPHTQQRTTLFRVPAWPATHSRRSGEEIWQSVSSLVPEHLRRGERNGDQSRWQQAFRWQLWAYTVNSLSGCTTSTSFTLSFYPALPLQAEAEMSWDDTTRSVSQLRTALVGKASSVTFFVKNSGRPCGLQPQTGLKIRHQRVF